MKDNIQVGLWKFTENETQRDRQRMRLVHILLLCCVVLCCVALPSLIYAKHMLYHQVTSSVLRDTQRGEGRKGNWKENKNRKQASGFLRGDKAYIMHKWLSERGVAPRRTDETVACDSVHPGRAQTPQLREQGEWRVCENWFLWGNPLFLGR